MSDTVNRPSHYTQGRTIEPIAAIEDWGLGFCLGNAVKYISRAGRKDPTKTVEDLLKARWYLDREITRLEAPKGLPSTRHMCVFVADSHGVARCGGCGNAWSAK